MRPPPGRHGDEDSEEVTDDEVAVPAGVPVGHVRSGVRRRGGHCEEAVVNRKTRTGLRALRTRIRAPFVFAALSALVAVLGAPVKWS